MVIIIKPCKYNDQREVKIQIIGCDEIRKRKIYKNIQKYRNTIQNRKYKYMYTHAQGKYIKINQI